MTLSSFMFLVSLLPTALAGRGEIELQFDLVELTRYGAGPISDLDEIETCTLADQPDSFYADAIALSRSYRTDFERDYRDDRPQSLDCEPGLRVTIDRGAFSKPQEYIADHRGIVRIPRHSGRITITLPKYITSEGHLAYAQETELEVGTRGDDHVIVQPGYTKYAKVILESEDSDYDPRFGYVCNAVWISETEGFVGSYCRLLDPRGRISPPQFGPAPLDPSLPQFAEDGRPILYFSFMSFSLIDCSEFYGNRETCREVVMHFEDGEVSRMHLAAIDGE